MKKLFKVLVVIATDVALVLAIGYLLNLSAVTIGISIPVTIFMTSPLMIKIVKKDTNQDEQHMPVTSERRHLV